MADPKKPKQLSESSALIEFAKTGNIYADPAYTSEDAIAALGGTSSITGETLVFNENTLVNFTANNNNSPAIQPDDGKAIFVSNLDRGTARGNGHDYFFGFNRGKMLYDTYIVNSKGGDYSASPRVADKYFADTDGTLNVYIEGSTFGGNLMGFGSQTDTSQTFTGNYELTFKKSVAQWFCITYGTGYGMGEGNAGNVRFGTVYGNIDLLVDGSTVTNNGVILAGGIHPGDGTEKAYLRAYIKDSLFQGEFGVIKTGVDGTHFKSEADVDITIDGSTFANVFLMFPNVSTNTQIKDGKNTTTGDVNFKATNTKFSGLNMGAGLGGTGWNRTGWIKGNINFDISGSSNSSRTFIHKGFVGSADEQETVTGTLTDSVFGDFTGYDTRENNYVYADTTIKITASTIGNFRLYNTVNSNTTEAVTPTADRIFGTQTLEITGSTAGSVAGNNPGADQPGATFNLVFNASETLSQVGAISGWNTVTINAGANVRATSVALLSDEGTFTIGLGSAVSIGSISTINDIYVTGELTEADTILISGLADDGVSGDLVIHVGDVEYTKGIFPGYYEVTGGNLTIHNASSTVLLVNSNYTDGQATELGPKGYSTFAAAQAAVTDKKSTSIMLYGMDGSVDPNVFTADVVTKDYTTSLIGEEGTTVSLDGFNLVVGDTAAAVATASVTASYTDYINMVKFGDVTESATVSIDHAGEDEETGIGAIDMTGAALTNVQVSVSDSYIGDVKLADNAASTGSVTIKNSEIENVYGGAGNVTADLTGENTIQNVYAEGNGSKIKLAGSDVDTYFAGSGVAGTAIDTLTFDDAVNAKNIVVGGNANKIVKIDADIAGGSAEVLKIGGDGDAISGDVDLTLAGGKFSTVSIAEQATVGGEVKVTLAGGTITNFRDGQPTNTADFGNNVFSTFYGLVYGASVTGALDGGTKGTARILNVEGHAKVGSVANFTELNVTGGTLNVAGGEGKSTLSDENSLVIDGDILNKRTINAGLIEAKNINNYGAIGTLRDVTAVDKVGITATGNVNNYDVILTSGMIVGGNLENTGKITAVGDISVGGTGTFKNSGDIYFYATSSGDGVFTQNGGLTLNNVDLVNTGFISAGSLTGVKNLTTSQMYVTGGAAITGNITIDAGAEVCFTNKANPEVENGLTLGGSITMGDTSNLVVSGDLTTTGTATITINVGDLIGANEVVRAEGGVNSWTIKLAGANAGMYSYAQDKTSVIVYSLGELFVNSEFSAEDGTIIVDGNELVYGINAFSSVEDAVAAAKTGAKIVIVGDKTGMAVNASGFDVVIDDSVVGDVTAKSVTVTSDSAANSIASAATLTIDAGAVLSVKETIADATAIKIDASKGTGSRLVLDVDASKVTLDASKVTIVAPNGKTYSALVLAGEATHAGDLYIISSDNAFYIPSLYKTVEEVLTPNFVDGDTFDAATGDALFNGVNTFGVRADAVSAAALAKGTFVLVDNVVGNKVGEEGVTSIIEVDAARGDDGQSRAVVGVFDSSNERYVSDQAHTTMIVGSTSRGNVYGLARLYSMSGDYTFVAKDSISTGASFFITGNNYGSVMDGNLNATIEGCTFGTTYIGYGSFGTEDFEPIDINVTVSDSRTGQFRGINISGSTAVTINANINIGVYDSLIGGAFYAIGTADWVNTAANIYQSHYVSGSINVEVGGTTVSNQFRPGDSLPHGANALQTFNVPATLHVVATEKSAITRADWVMEWDTIIIDADATLLVNHGLEYINAYKDSGSAEDNGGQLIQIYVNMSGYAGGTRTVIAVNPDKGDWEGFINTDANLSNISVIGDNDLTGQRMLVYGQNTASGSVYHLNRVAVFDKASDMYVNASYTEAVSGTTASDGQDLYYNANAHSNFEGALFYANDWGGTIIVTGGTFGAQDFNGNDVDLREGQLGAITMGDRQVSFLRVSEKATFESADGSGKSALDVEGNAVLGDVTNFVEVVVDKGAKVTFGDVSSSDIVLYADNEILADSLNFSDATITIDVAKYVGSPHVVISTENGITGNASNVKLVGKDADKFGVILSANDLILTTTIPSDTYLNSTYTAATTGTILADGTYLQYGFNAFSDADAAVAALGSTKNTLTVTGGTFASDIQLAGANFTMEDGKVEGFILGTKEDDFSGMNITIEAGSVGGIALTAGDGVYTVSKAAITFGDSVTVEGTVVGAGDTTLTLLGDATVGGIEDMKLITLSTGSLLNAGYIDLNGGTIYVTGAAAGGAQEGNLTKIISTEAGITGATYTCDEGLTVYASGKDVYLMDLSHIYFDPTFTEAVTGTTMANGDVLQWGSNAFSDLATALGKVTQNTGTLYVSNYSGDVVNNTTAGAINLNISGGAIGTFRPISGDRSTAKIYNPITIDIDGATLTAGVDYILGRGNRWDNVGNSLVYYAPVTVNLSNGRNNENIRFVGQWSTFSGGLTLNLTNWDLRGDFKPIVGDARAGASDDAHSFLDVTFDNVTVGNAGAKWISLADVTDWGPLDYISLTVKNSTIMSGTGGNNMRIAAFNDGNNQDGRHGSAVPIFFTVEDSHINGLFSASGLSNNSVASGSYATLTIKGSSNYVKWANWFQVVNMTADTYLRGGTVTFRSGTYQVGDESIETTGVINVDATGYTGGSKILISLETGFQNVEPGSESFLLNLTQDADKYVLVAGTKGLVIWDGVVSNLFYNPNFVDNNAVIGQSGPNGEVLLKTVYEDDEETIKILGNAYGEAADYDELLGFEAAKSALAAGNTLYITGGTFGSADDLTPIYGTIAAQDETAFVNLGVTGGQFAGITIAEDGKTVAGNADLELAGGIYGFTYTYEEDREVPVVVDGETTTEWQTVTLTGWTGGDIVGSKDSVGGISALSVTGAITIRGNVSEFDKMTVSANARVAGDITVDALEIDCNAALTVNGALDVGALHLASAEYTGPSKVVLTSDALQTFDQSLITVDGEDGFLVKGNELWLISEDPGNVYICTGFNDGINGTVYNGDMLFFGVNAFTSIDEAIAHTTSDYTMYVLDGNYNEVIDLTGLGQVQLQLDGGTFAGFKIGDGADSDHRSTVRITANTSSVKVGSITGIEGSTVGYRVIANKDATITTIDGIQYLRIGAGKNVTVTDAITYREQGGELVVDLAGYTAGAAASILAPKDGIANFIQLVDGETFSRTTVGSQNNGGYVLYYDEEKKSVVAAPNGNVIVLDKTNNNSTYYNGKTVVFNGQTTTLVYNYNVSDWNFGGLSQQIPLDGKLEVKEGYWFSNFFTQPIRTIELSGSTIEWMSAGPNEAAAPADRTGNYSFTAENSRFQGWAYLAGRGTSGTHMGVIVGTVDPETSEVTDGVYDIVLKDTVLATGTGDFNVVKYANIKGGTANVTMDNFQIEGDFQLFNYVYDYEGESLDEVNVTIKNSQAPAAKWMGVWDPQEYNETTVNIWITDTNFAADNNDHTFGIFGTHDTADWNGEAHVYISGVTMAGRLSGARGTNGGNNANRILGTRTLHVSGTANNILTTREFTTIDIEDGAVLKGDTILMPGTASGAAFTGFILRGEAGYTGEVKEYAVMGTTISGIEQDAAMFVDKDGVEIAGYKAVIGNTTAFIYMPTYDVYFDSSYSANTTGASITEADGKKNFLVYGDNAVTSMREAYKAIDARGGTASIQVLNAVGSNLYTNGYKTVLNGGQVVNVYGGTYSGTHQVPGIIDPETGEPTMIDVPNDVDPVASVDITINKGASVTNVNVATDYSKVTGDATITVNDGAILTGTLNGANDNVGGVSSLVFTASASAKAITGFDNVTLNANNVVTLSGTFTGTVITIDTSNFADFTKKVLVAEGGFGDVAGITVNVADGFGYQFLDDGVTLCVTSGLVGNTYADYNWTEADVHNKFVGDMALVWDANAFDSAALAAQRIGEGSTLYIEGGTSAEAITLTKKNDVIISANTSGTVVGSIAADGGTLTVETDFTATTISGFSGIAVNAVDDITIGSIALAENGTITVDLTGYTQTTTDAAVLTVAGGITGLIDERIVLTGEGSGAFHAYYSHIDNSIHTMRIDNFYVDTAFGTAGENIVEGQTNPITGETLLWGVNAFYYLNDALGKMAPGQGLYINGRIGNNVNTGDRMANIYLTGSTVPVIINGFTTGDQTYVGDVDMTIVDSTFGTAAGSYLFGTVTVNEAWNHNQHIFGNVTLNVVGSTIGQAGANTTVQGYQLVNVYGTEEAPALVTFNFTDTAIYDDMIFIGDSPVGKTAEIDGQTYTEASVVINMTNVETPADKWWRIQDGDQESQGSITVNIQDSTFGDGRDTMRLALDNNWGMGWDTHAPRSNSDFIFNFQNVDFKGYLLAGRLDYNSNRDAELTSYTGKKVLNLTGANNISYTYWFRELNLASDATLTGKTLRMGTTGAAINIDVTGYTGASKVFINMDNAFENVTLDDITVTGLDETVYTIVTDFDPEAEAPALTAVVLKGAIKDIYVNSDYSEELKLGTSYNGEALFFGENAFKTADEGIAALTDGAVFFVTGGKVKTAALKSNSITIDATAQLTYNGNTVISVDGNVVNDGTFVISAGGFVDGTQTDILVLTATAISGEGVFRTDDSAYTVNVVGNEVHLVMKKLDVYVNTAWADLEPEAIVEVPGGTAVIGTDAFATADAAAAAVSVNGSITILSSEVKFTNPIVRTVTATEGSTVLQAAVGTGAAVGSLTLQSGAVATQASVRAKGTLTVEAGATVTGGLGMLTGAVVSFAEGSVLDFDISAQAAGESASVTNYSILTGAPSITITISAGQADGTYALATDAASFNSNAVLQTTAGKIGDLVFGQTVQIDGIDYTLALDDNNVLSLTKKVYVAPITVTYVNEAWANLAPGTVVSGATIGYDGFATGDAAIAALTVDYGEVKVLAGNVYFSDTINKTVTVNADATLTGKATFATAVTINGTVAFDTALATAEAAQINGFSFVSGTATYTLTDAAAATGTYLLASDAAAFASDVVFGNYTLKLGESVIVNDALTYTLGITDNNDLALTIATYVPPTPEPPTLAYVNSAWTGKKAGDTVTVGTKTATIGYDAFAALDPAVEAVTDDGSVEVVGSEISINKYYSKPITVDAGATIVGKGTFTDLSLTVNGTIAFDTQYANDGAQFVGFQYVTGNATYTLAADAVAGTWTLASDAMGFDSDIQFGNYTLKLGEETVIDGFSYTVSLVDMNYDLILTVAEVVPPPPPTYVAKSDINATGISDVLFQYAGLGVIGFWLDGTNTWQSTNATHPTDAWTVLGAYDMTANGKADTVLVGDIVLGGISMYAIGYYIDSVDAIDGSTWANISYLGTDGTVTWQNKIGNLTGNANCNSIVWHSPSAGALGVWTDGTDNWVDLGGGYLADGGWDLVGCGDFTGAGRDSVIMSYAGQVFYTVDIEGTFSALTSTDAGWEIRAIGDFSGDGKDDIVAFHAETGLVAMWGDGDAQNNWSLLGQLDANDWFVVGAGDYNNDQKDDLLVRQYSTGMLGYYSTGDMAQWVELGRGVNMDWTVIA